MHAVGTWKDFLFFGGNMGDWAHWLRTWRLNRSTVKWQKIKAALTGW